MDVFICVILAKHFSLLPFIFERKIHKAKPGSSLILCPQRDAMLKALCIGTTMRAIFLKMTIEYG